jgi:signal transduction histidine kinase
MSEYAVSKDTVSRNTSGQDTASKEHLLSEIAVLRQENITLRNNYEKAFKEKKQAEENVARLEMFELIGQMTSSITHEIRNPLNSVYGMLQLLNKKSTDKRNKKDYSLMLSELKRANSIIDEFLIMSKNKSLELRYYNLNNIINKILPLIHSNVQMNDKYLNVQLSEIPDLLIDEYEIRKIIFNMVRNGLEAMDAHKCLTIKTYRKEDNVVLAFQDEGCGISPDVMPKIGTPFFTTKGNGTGLGLSVCYNIVKQHKGIIDVESEIGTGTTFTIILPCIEDDDFDEVI